MHVTDRALEFQEPRVSQHPLLWEPEAPTAFCSDNAAIRRSQPASGSASAGRLTPHLLCKQT